MSVTDSQLALELVQLRSVLLLILGVTLIPAKKVKARSVSEPVEESPRQVPVASAPVFTDPEDKEYLLADDPVDQVVEENWLEETDDLEEQRIRRKQQRAERKRLRRQQRKDRRRRVA